jgi:hypothetical protein
VTIVITGATVLIPPDAPWLMVLAFATYLWTEGRMKTGASIIHITGRLLKITET